MIQLEHHHFVTFNESVDLGNDHRWLLTYHKEMELNIMRLAVDGVIDVHPDIPSKLTKAFISTSLGVLATQGS